MGGQAQARRLAIPEPDAIDRATGVILLRRISFPSDCTCWYRVGPMTDLGRHESDMLSRLFRVIVDDIELVQPDGLKELFLRVKGSLLIRTSFTIDGYRCRLKSVSFPAAGGKETVIEIPKF